MESTLWVEKYRPQKIEDCILTNRARKQFNTFLSKAEIPNLLLAGPPGIGKTTIARALALELGADSVMINASSEGNIDTLRNDIRNFVSTVSLTTDDVSKVVILDEADYLTTVTQPALRNFMEKFSSNARFILTCNYPSRILEALHSRMTAVDMSIRKEDKAAVLKAALARVTYILEAENVEFDKKVVGQMLIDSFPDFRQLLIKLQALSDLGPITKITTAADDFDVLIEALKIRDFLKIRRWAAETTLPFPDICRKFFNQCTDLFHSDSVPTLILLTGEYQYKATFVADQEINLVAYLVSIMGDCRFK